VLHPDPLGELTAFPHTSSLDFRQGRGSGKEQDSRREKKFINHKQINDVTIKIINLCGRLPTRKIPSSWPPMQIQIILFYM